MRYRPIARERRHTLRFLDEIRAFAPVFLDTDVDMTRVREHRATARADGRPYSSLAYVLYAAARVLAAHPEANAAIRGRIRPRVARYASVHGKFTMDKTLDGHRVVLAGIVRDTDRASLDDIQQRIDHFRAGDPATMPEFAPARLLQRLPWPIGPLVFRLGVRPLGRRPQAMGTLAVTSLGHRPVDSFFSVGGATITLGLGQTADRPVVQDGQIAVAPTMRLSLTFDHRVIDGAEAADVLAEIKAGLESFEPAQAARPAGTATDRESVDGNDIAELKQYVVAHARGQQIRGYQRLLDGIRSDRGGEPGSWVGEWSGAGTSLASRGRHLEASRHYAMARFPYVNGPAREEALTRCIGALDQWRSRRSDIEPVEVDLKGGRVRCWTSGLSPTDRKPLLLVMGGIVTIKEQWAPMLAMMRRLGMAGLVTEMPAVGENTLGYDPESWRMLSGVLDAVADRADVSQTYALALSFSGHMALRCAVEDARIRGVITVGAPIREFFTDVSWQCRLPRVTVDTLGHMIGIPPQAVVGGLGQWALTGEQLAALDIPVAYTASSRDEIIPAGDVQLLRENVRDLELVVHDDVHGSPGHVGETRLWTAASLLRARDVHNAQTALIGLLLRWQRARRRRDKR
jgi:hypothetical protein